MTAGEGPVTVDGGFEAAKRLPPTFTTLRDLFVHSGNQCAFPGCRRGLVNSKGQWVGEVCHIEAASPAGQRFNRAMTNEERRQRSNLMLMCHEHHVETNDVEEFPVRRLREIKASHEEAFSGSTSPLSEAALKTAVEEIVASEIVDHTDRVELHLPQTLAKFGELLEFGLTSDELRGSIAAVEPGLRALRRVPVDARSVLAIVVDRGYEYMDDLAVPAHEIESATALDQQALANQVQTLARYGLASFEEDYDPTWSTTVILIGTHPFDGWGFWRALKTYCERADLELKPLINELRFDLLD